ncbi:MATE family efflux transporter [Sulfurospirillum sp. 1612]|uniref:MATE family efflux transporter n=1 Tax=Sulfurospirillum sp. 1612 TaxID=3094835 RepID=UPI002F9220DF
MDTDLTQGSVKKHLHAIALPSAIGYVFQTMFNVTDTFFAGQISTQAVAALSLTFSIFFMIIALAGGMSQGVTALIGNALGENNKDHAKQMVMHSFILFVVLSVTLCIIGLFFAPYLMRLLGAHGAYLKEALAYINIIIYGSSFFIAVFFTNAILIAIGNTKVFRNFLIFGFFLNTLLDYWFVKGGFGIPAMGVRGIGLATIIIEFIGMVYLFIHLKRSYLLKNMPRFKFDSTILYAFVKQGLPPTANMLLMALGMFIITYFIAIFGKHVVAAYGISVRIEQIFLLPSIGINVAVLSIVSQNNGAKLYTRIKETVDYAQKLGLILWILGMILIYLFGRDLMLIFTKDSQVISAGLGYLYAAATSLYAYMLVFINISLLQGIKKPALLVYLSLARQLIVPILLFSALKYFSMPLIFYWYGIVMMIWLSAFFILWYAKRELNILNL